MKFKFGDLLAAESIHADVVSETNLCSPLPSTDNIEKVPLMLSLFVPPPLPDTYLSPGTVVIIDGLTKAPQFNGWHGVVEGYEPETDRYDVRLVSLGAPDFKQNAEVRRENLQVANSREMMQGDEDDEIDMSSEEDEYMCETAAVPRRRR